MATDPEMLRQIQQMVERWGARGPAALPLEPEPEPNGCDSDADAVSSGQAAAQDPPDTLPADIQAALEAQAPAIDVGRSARRLQSEFMNWRNKHGFEPSLDDWQRLRRMGEDALSVGVMWPH